MCHISCPEIVKWKKIEKKGYMPFMKFSKPVSQKVAKSVISKFAKKVTLPKFLRDPLRGKYFEENIFYVSKQ